MNRSDAVGRQTTEVASFMVYIPFLVPPASYPERWEKNYRALGLDQGGALSTRYAGPHGEPAAGEQKERLALTNDELDKVWRKLDRKERRAHVYATEAMLPRTKATRLASSFFDRQPPPLLRSLQRIPQPQHLDVLLGAVDMMRGAAPDGSQQAALIDALAPVPDAERGAIVQQLVRFLPPLHPAAHDSRQILLLADQRVKVAQALLCGDGTQRALKLALLEVLFSPAANDVERYRFAKHLEALAESSAGQSVLKTLSWDRAALAPLADRPQDTLRLLSLLRRDVESQNPLTSLAQRVASLTPAPQVPSTLPFKELSARFTDAESALQEERVRAIGSALTYLKRVGPALSLSANATLQAKCPVGRLTPEALQAVVAVENVILGFVAQPAYHASWLLLQEPSPEEMRRELKKTLTPAEVYALCRPLGTTCVLAQAYRTLVGTRRATDNSEPIVANETFKYLDADNNRQEMGVADLLALVWSLVLTKPDSERPGKVVLRASRERIFLSYSLVMNLANCIDTRDPHYPREVYRVCAWSGLVLNLLAPLQGTLPGVSIPVATKEEVFNRYLEETLSSVYQQALTERLPLLEHKEALRTKLTLAAGGNERWKVYFLSELERFWQADFAHPSHPSRAKLASSAPKISGRHLPSTALGAPLA